MLLCLLITSILQLICFLISLLEYLFCPKHFTQFILKFFHTHCFWILLTAFKWTSVAIVNHQVGTQNRLISKVLTTDITRHWFQNDNQLIREFVVLGTFYNFPTRQAIVAENIIVFQFSATVTKSWLVAVRRNTGLKMRLIGTWHGLIFG